MRAAEEALHAECTRWVRTRRAQGIIREVEHRLAPPPPPPPPPPEDCLTLVLRRILCLA